MTIEDRITALVEEVRLEHAPDPRLSVFDIGVERNGSILTLVGATSEPAAAEELHRRLGVLDGSMRVQDRIVRLPEDGDADRPHALVASAVAPMLAGPMVAECHVSQALLGHRLMVLRRRGRWLQVRSDDGYLGWVHRGYVARVDETTARAWEIGAAGEVCMSLGADVRGADGELVVRLPWGSRVVRRDDGEVVLPDGLRGRAEGELLPLSELAAAFPAAGEAVVETASRWLGAPYLWGGTTPAGVDCSGLVQAVFRTHGVELPRDSDQQANRGDPIDPGPDFSRLLPGDLLFFAEEPGRISHVTVSTGGSAIIHSSLGNGGVRRNDLAGSQRFEEELKRLFVCARRVLNG